MPKLLRVSSLVQMRRMALLFVGAVLLHGLPACAMAQTVPESLRACTAVSDPGQRLACYDREMARLSPSSAPRAAAPAPSKADHAPTPVAAEAGRSSATAPVGVSLKQASSEQAREQAPPSPNSNPGASDASGGEAAAAHRAPSWKIFGNTAPSRFTARVASLDRWPDAMVLHLDNGQVWQQMGRASGDLSLRVGDSVTIEKHLGSYWLSSRYVSNMKVRLKPQ